MTRRFASDRSYRGDARECERRNGEDAHERVEARAGRGHTNLQSGNPADSGGGRSRNPSPVALRPRVTPGLPFSAGPSRAGTALAVCHDPTPPRCACAPSNLSQRGAVPWSGGPMGPSTLLTGDGPNQPPGDRHNRRSTAGGTRGSRRPDRVSSCFTSCAPARDAARPLRPATPQIQARRPTQTWCRGPRPIHHPRGRSGVIRPSPLCR